MKVLMRPVTPAGLNLEAIAMTASRVTPKMINIKMVAVLMILMIPAGHICRSLAWWLLIVHMVITSKNFALKILPRKQIGQMIQMFPEIR